MSLFSAMKRNARHALQGRWGKAVQVLLVMLAVDLVLALFLGVATYALGGGLPPSNPTMEQLDRLNAMLPQIFGTQGVVMLFSLFLITPLSLGSTLWYLSAAKGTPQPVSVVFSFYERLRRYGRAVLYGVNMLVRTMLWAIAFFTLPTAVLAATITFTRQFVRERSRQLAVFSALGMVIACFLMLLAVVLYLAWMNKYFLTPYLLADDENMTVRAAIRQSVQLTQGSRFHLLWYTLSFAGWALLTALFFPLMFYTIPYINTSFAVFAQFLMEKGRARAADSHTREFSRAAQETAEALGLAPEEQAAAAEPTVQISREEIARMAESTLPQESAPVQEPSPAPQAEAPPASEHASPPPAQEPSMPAYTTEPDTPQAREQWELPSPPPPDQDPPQPGRWPYV